jgi:hypothetical protein
MFVQAFLGKCIKVLKYYHVLGRFRQFRYGLDMLLKFLQIKLVCSFQSKMLGWCDFCELAGIKIIHQVVQLTLEARFETPS